MRILLLGTLLLLISCRADFSKAFVMAKENRGDCVIITEVTLNGNLLGDYKLCYIKP